MAKGNIERYLSLKYSLKAAAIKHGDKNTINNHPLKEKYYEKKFLLEKIFFLIIILFLLNAQFSWDWDDWDWRKSGAKIK